MRLASWAACLPARPQPLPPKHLLCASFWGHNRGKTDETGPLGAHSGAGGPGEITCSQAAYQMQDTRKEKDTRLSPVAPPQSKVLGEC